MKQNTLAHRAQIMINSYDIGAVIFSNKIMTMLLFFPLFKTDGFRAIPYLAEVCNIMIAVLAGIFGVYTLLCGTTSRFLKIMIFYAIWNYIIAPFFSGEQRPSLFYVLGMIMAISFVEVGVSYNCKLLFKSLSELFTIMICLNYILSIVFPNGICGSSNGAMHLFGLRTGFSLFVIPGIIINFISDYLNRKIYFSSRTMLCCIFGMVSLLSQWVATGIIEIILLIAIYTLVIILPYTRMFDIRFATIIILLLNFSISIFNKSNVLFEIVSKVLNRDVTLSGRTYIWEKCVEKLSGKPFVGYGSDAIVDIYSYMKAAHNQWLHVALESGYIGLVIFIIGIMFSVWKLYSYRKKNIYYIVAIGIVTMLVGSIAEIQTYVPYIYIIFELPYLIEYMDKSENTQLPKKIVEWR